MARAAQLDRETRVLTFRAASLPAFGDSRAQVVGGAAAAAPVTTTQSASQHERQRRADGAACLAAALNYRRLGWSVLGLCPPDHVGVGKTHVKSCTSPGKVPFGPWKEFQERLPTEAELHQKWR